MAHPFAGELSGPRIGCHNVLVSNAAARFVRTQGGFDRTRNIQEPDSAFQKRLHSDFVGSIQDGGRRSPAFMARYARPTQGNLSKSGGMKSR